MLYLYRNEKCKVITLLFCYLQPHNFHIEKKSKITNHEVHLHDGAALPPPPIFVKTVKFIFPHSAQLSLSPTIVK